MVPSKMFIRHWSTSKGPWCLVLSKTIWHGPNPLMDNLNSAKYDQTSRIFWHRLNVLWMFWTELSIFSPCKLTGKLISVCEFFVFCFPWLGTSNTFKPTYWGGFLTSEPPSRASLLTEAMTHFLKTLDNFPLDISLWWSWDKHG